MYKTFKLIALLILLPCITTHSIERATIRDGIVKGSTHYHLINTTKWENTKKPKAFFYRYNSEQKNNTFLGEIEVDVLNEQTIEHLDKLIDPQATLPTIKRAVIAHCIKRGRFVTFYDENGDEVDISHRYNGSVNIKSEFDLLNHILC